MKSGKEHVGGDIIQISKDDYADLISLLATRESDFQEYSFIVNNKCLGEDVLLSAEKARRLSQGHSELLSIGGSPKSVYLRQTPQKPADFEEKDAEVCKSNLILPAASIYRADSSGTCQSNEAYNSDGSKENRSTERNSKLYSAAGRKAPDSSLGNKPHPTLFGSIISSLNTVTSFIKDDKPKLETCDATSKRENSSASSERKTPRVIELNRAAKPHLVEESSRRDHPNTPSRIPTISKPIEIRSKATQGIPADKGKKSSASAAAVAAVCQISEKKPFLEALNMFRRKEVEGKKDAEAEVLAAMTSPRAVTVTTTAAPTSVVDPTSSSQPPSGSVKDRIARLKSLDEPVATRQDPIVVDIDESSDAQIAAAPRHVEGDSGVLAEPLKPVHALVSAFQTNAAPNLTPAPLPRSDSGSVSGSSGGVPSQPPRPISGAATSTSIVPFTKSYSLRAPTSAAPPPRTAATRTAPPGARPAVPLFSANTAASKTKPRDGISPVTSPRAAGPSSRAAATTSSSRGPPSGNAISTTAFVPASTATRAGSAAAVKRSPRLLEKAKSIRVGAAS